MPCFKPLKAVKTEDGIKFNAMSGEGDPLNLPCGQCLGCRIDRSRMWAVRCMHEASEYQQNCFLTLTYNDENLPKDGSLNYRDFQLFMKRLRKKTKDIRFYMCGEYGETTQRPHYHAIIFNWYPEDAVLHSNNRGNKLFTSELVQDTWGKGFAPFGAVTEQSAAYVARYINTKITGKDWELNPKTGRPYGAKYERLNPDTGEIYRVEPEFNKMSRKPGIGQAWFDKYYTDVYPRDSVRLRDGRSIRPPRFYDAKYDALEPYEFEAIKQQRILNALKKAEDNTPERLHAKESVLAAKTKKLVRPIL